MARGKEIVMDSPNVRGKFEEGIVSGTPKPGTCMEIVPNTAPVGGRFTWRAWTRNDGAKGPIVVLREDALQGKTTTDAYVSGTRCFLYWPCAGDHLNMLLRYQPGTGTSLNENIGDLLEVDGATGMLQGVGTGGPTGSHASSPFWLMEDLGVALTANTLVWVQYLGNQA